MPLSNAERQRRFRRKRNTLAGEAARTRNVLDLLVAARKSAASSHPGAEGGGAATAQGIDPETRLGAAEMAARVVATRFR